MSAPLVTTLAEIVISPLKRGISGNNALDFCVVFYVGLNADRFKNAHIIIYSKDKKDYDPLIKHLKSVGMNIERLEYKEVKEPFVLIEKQSNKTTTKNVSIEKIYNDTLVHFQVKQTKARPRKIKTLKTYLQETVFNKKYSTEIIEQIIELMIKNKIVEKTNENGAIKFNKGKL